MPSHELRMKIDAPIEAVWKFVGNKDNWAVLIPGYIEHEILNNMESTWKFKSELGILKKKIHLKLDIMNWNEPKSVTFYITGLNEKFTGSGFVRTNRIGPSETLITGNINIEAKGTIGKIITALIKSDSPEIPQEFREEVTMKIRQYYSNQINK